MGDPMDSRTPKTARNSFNPGGNGGVSLKWIERELSRLDDGKVDKAHYKPALENIKEKCETLAHGVADVENDLKDRTQKLRKELRDEITNVYTTASRAEKHAANPTCHRDERIEIMEEAVKFWSTWFLRGLVGMIMLLLTAGGGWVYSHVRLEETAKQSSKAVKEFKTEVDKVRIVQQEQGATLSRIENSEKSVGTEEVEAALRDVLHEVLEEKKGKH